MRAILVICLAACAGCTGRDGAAVFRARGIPYEKSMKTWVDLRDRNLVYEEYDLSCGMAALATVMRHAYGEAVTEEDIIADLEQRLSEEEVVDRQDHGLNSLDLVGIAQRRGYEAEWRPMGLGELASLHVPVIVEVLLDDIRHFSVLRGIRSGRAFLADPIDGNIGARVDELAAGYGGHALFLSKPGQAPIESAFELEGECAIRNETQVVRNGLFRRR